MNERIRFRKPSESLNALCEFAGIKVDDFVQSDDALPGRFSNIDGENSLSNVRRFIRSNLNVLTSSNRESKYLSQILRLNDCVPSDKATYEDERVWLLMKDMLDSWPDAIYFKNREGRLILVNEAYARGVRNKFINWIGLQDSDIYSSQEAAAMMADDEWVMSTGKMIIDKLECITFVCDGTKHYVSTTKVPRWDDKGNVVGLMGITRDVTNRVNLYEMLFATYQGCIFITTKEGKWVDINEEGAKLFGYSGKEEFIARTSVQDIYFNPSERQKYMRAMREAGKVKNYEIRLKKKDGTPIDVQVTAAARYDQSGRIQGYHGTIRDVTEEKIAQMEGKKKINDLTKRLNTITSHILKAITNSLKILCPGQECDAAISINSMTGKEKELFPLFILGKSDQEISELTNCPKETVARYRYDIYKKN